MEAKASNQRRALERAQAGLRFAAKRRNRSALMEFTEAWRLDPRNMDYSYNAAQFAEGLKEDQQEFLAYTRFMNVAEAALPNVPPGDSPFRATLTERMNKAKRRLAVLRKTISSGTLRVVTTPGECDIFLDDHLMGSGNAQMESITGQHKVRVTCTGFKTLEQFVNVRVGDTNEVRLKPSPIAYFGYLWVNVKPKDGVTIFLDDVPVTQRMGKQATEQGAITGAGSKIDPYRLHARKWIIRFKKDGYDRWHRRIEIKRDRIFRLDVAMEKMGETVGNQCR